MFILMSSLFIISSDLKKRRRNKNWRRRKNYTCLFWCHLFWFRLTAERDIDSRQRCNQRLQFADEWFPLCQLLPETSLCKFASCFQKHISPYISSLLAASTNISPFYKLKYYVSSLLSPFQFCTWIFMQDSYTRARWELKLVKNVPGQIYWRGFIFSWMNLTQFSLYLNVADHWSYSKHNVAWVQYLSWLSEWGNQHCSRF